MHPRLRPHFSVIAHSPDLVEIRYGVWNATSFTLRDETGSGKLCRLLLRLDGSVSVEDIAASERVGSDEVEGLIERLNELGVLEAGASNAIDFVLDRTSGASAAGLEGQSRTTPVKLIGDAELANAIADLIRGTLPDTPIVAPSPTDTGLPHDRRPQSDDRGEAAETELARFGQLHGHFVIVAQRVVDPNLLHDVNRICISLGTPWLHAAIDGPFLFVGPLTLPHRSACFDCFERRVMMNLRESASYQKYKRAIAERLVRAGRVPVEPVVRSLLAAHTAIEAVNYLLTAHSCCVNKVLSIYLPSMEFIYHEVLRVPNCRSCARQSPAVRRELHFDLSAVVGSSRAPRPT